MTVSQKWDKRVGQWHDHVISAAAFGKVLDRILVLSQPQPSDVCVDLGAGTGFVTTALALLVASVHAVDISPAMTEALAARTADAGLANVSTEVTDLKDFRLPPSYADLIVSSYALHHLADADKRALTARAAHWLCPGGRLVIADMMFGRGESRARSCHLAPGSGRARRQGDRRMVADREEPDPLRLARRAGAARQRRSSGSRRRAMRGWPRCASIRSPPKPALSSASARHPRYGLMRAPGDGVAGGLAGGARTVKKSLVHPATYWPDGRSCPGISAVSAPPGLLAASSWTHSGLMSSSIAISAPWPASAAARSAGTADMLAAYIRCPAASWPIALRATNAPPPRVAPHSVQSADAAVGRPFSTSGCKFCRTL